VSQTERVVVVIAEDGWINVKDRLKINKTGPTLSAFFRYITLTLKKGFKMECPICGSNLIFVEEGPYFYGRHTEQMAQGRFYECERCGAEVVKRSGGKLRVESHPEPDMVTRFEMWDDWEYQVLMGRY